LGKVLLLDQCPVFPQLKQHFTTLGLVALASLLLQAVGMCSIVGLQVAPKVEQNAASQ